MKQKRPNGRDWMYTFLLSLVLFRAGRLNGGPEKFAV
jgi:hypothetical protein